MANVKFYVGSQVLSTKKWMREKQIWCAVSEIQEITDNATPASNHKKVLKFGIKIFNGTYPLSFLQKLQNFKYEHQNFTH